MIEIAAQVFGMVFVGIIIICLIWTIGNSIAEASSPNKKLLNNMNKLDKKKRALK